MTEIQTQHAKPKSRKAIGLILILIGVAVVLAMGALVLYKILSAPRIATMLPEKQTVAMFEVDVNYFNGQFNQFRELTAGYPSYSAQNMVNTLFHELNIDYEKDVQPWFGAKIGMALMASPQQSEEVSEVFFIESGDHEKARAFMEKFKMTHHEETIQESHHRGTTIYSYKLSNNLNFFFTKHYLVISDNKQHLQSIINVLTGEQTNVEGKSEYQQIANNLGNQYLAFAYVNLENGLDFLRKDPRYNQIVGSELSMYMPLLKIYSSGGMTLSTYKSGLKVNTYTTVSKDKINNKPYFTYENKYQGRLLKYLPQNSIASFSGHNLAAQLKRFEQLLNDTNSASRVKFKGEVNKVITKIIGADFEFDNHLAPILKKEYIFSINQSINNPAYLFMIELNNRKQVEKLKDKLDTALNNITARANPKIQKVTLDDGTEGQEIVIDFESTNKNAEDINGTIIHSFSSVEGNKSIHYAYNDSIFLISTSKATIKAILEGRQDEEDLSAVEQTILRSSDEMGVIELKKLWPAVKFVSTSAIDYLVPFGNITYGKEYFDNGVVGEYYLHIIPYGQN